MFKNIVTNAVTGLANTSHKLEKKWVEHNTCNNAEKSEKLIHDNIETIDHIMSCHVCRQHLLNAVNAYRKEQKALVKMEKLSRQTATVREG